MTRFAGSRDDDAALAGRVVENLDRTVRSLADEIRPVESGWVARAGSLPLVWTLNQLRVTGRASFPDVVALADHHQGDLPYRHVVVEDDVAGRLLEESFGAAGWRVDCEVLMALEGLPDPAVDTTAVIALTEPQMLALMRRWIVEERPNISAEALDQVDEYNRREGRLWNEQIFGRLDRGGDPAAITKLRSDGTTAWVEDVYTVPAERGRGFARTLVTHATELARSSDHDLTFIVADDRDWPKNLYGRVGFRETGKIWAFHRDLDSST